MRFGVFLGPIFPGDMAPESAFAFALETARAARDSGLDGVFVGQHYLVGPSHLMFSPLLLLARVAGDCPGLDLGTAIFVLPLHHPVEAAEATATLDVICGGKLILGVGAGYRQVEFDSFGVAPVARSKRLAEGVRALRGLWSADDATFDGQQFQFKGVSIRPRPLQLGGPPIWIGADTKRGVAQAATIGDAWLASGRQSKGILRSLAGTYRSKLDELGRPFTGVPMFREMHVALDGQRAQLEMKDAFERMYASYARWGQPGERYDQEFEMLRRERIIVGDPDECAEEVRRYAEEFEVPFMFFRAYWPGMEPEQALAAIRLFGREVIPRLRQ
jgi:alkanesulfonate monooxygenase SsuD/methylene tetrahydromethanopterin reductase-like flavin-dependent oxidoreductase (luciferase family)